MLLNLSSYLLIITLLSIGGCGSSATSTTVSSSGSDQLTSVPAPAKHLSMINFFIETSGSMKGYMPSNSTPSEFQQLIPDFLRRLRDDNNLTFYSIFDSKSKFIKENFQQVVESKIPKGDFVWSGDTYITKIIDSLGRYLNTNSVNVFVSDCIYSPEPGSAGNTVQEISQIRSVFNSVSKNYATSVLSFTSKFYHKGRPVVNSPYYIILQGKAENLMAVKKMLIQSANTFSLPYFDINFGFSSATPFYSVLPYTEISGSYISEKNKKNQGYQKLNDIEVVPGQPNEFWLGIDLSAYPAYTRDISYLKRNLSIGCDHSIVKIIDWKTKFGAVKADENLIIGKCTDYIRIRFSDFTVQTATINLSLKSIRPDWISKLSSNTLSSSETNRQLTYGLENIITGIDQAYNKEGNAQYFFNDVHLEMSKKE